MGVAQYADVVCDSEPFPLWSCELPKTTCKRLAGNGMHASVVGALHAVILATLVVKPSNL